ncbi:MAG: 50S ribosomal protein L24 [bacterium]
MRIRKDDLVVVLTGDDRGRRGKVLKVFPGKKTAVVQGINFQKKHTRPTKMRQEAGVLEKEGPIHVSNLKVICPKCGQPARMSHLVSREGARERICKKCGEII